MKYIYVKLRINARISLHFLLIEIISKAIKDKRMKVLCRHF